MLVELACGVIGRRWRPQKSAVAPRRSSGASARAPAARSTTKPQSRPAAMSRSYMPYVTEAVVSGNVRIATSTARRGGHGRFVGFLAEMTLVLERLAILPLHPASPKRAHGRHVQREQEGLADHETAIHEACLHDRCGCVRARAIRDGAPAVPEPTSAIPIATIDEALQAAPAFIAGHLLKALVLYTLAERKFVPMASEALDAARRTPRAPTIASAGSDRGDRIAGRRPLARRVRGDRPRIGKSPA